MNASVEPTPGRLAGKIALITGTGGGQGRAAAIAFAREGATIIGCDITAAPAAETVELVQAAGGRMSSHTLDLSEPAQVVKWVSDSVAEFGGLDIVYNNAGAARFASIADMSMDDWRASIRNELDVVFNTTQAAWKHLVARGGGAIVNTASVQGFNAIVSAPGGFAHAMTKHGIIGMSRELAAEGGPVGIRVNTVSPGLIITPATVGMTEVPGLVESIVDKQIVKRTGRPEDIALAALFLVSDEASFITGTNLIVDGGYLAI